MACLSSGRCPLKCCPALARVSLIHPNPQPRPNMLVEIGSGDNTAAIRGAEKEELMKRAILRVSAAAATALAPLCIPPAQAHAGDPCVRATDPAAHKACIDKLRDFWRYQRRACAASPIHGQVGHAWPC